MADHLEEYTDRFLWSSDEYRLQTFLEHYRPHLPIIVKTSTGYCGYDGLLHDVSCDEIFVVFEIHEQERVIAVDDDGCYVSIPLDYELNFHKVIASPTSLDGHCSIGPPMRMSALLADNWKQRSKSTRKFEFESDPKVAFDFEFGKNRTKRKFGQLSVVETYSEKYLLAYPILSGEIYDIVVAIPVYMPIAIEVLKSMKDDTELQFIQWMGDVNEIVQGFGKHSFQPCQDILLFDELPAGDYEYMRPSMYVRQSVRQNQPQPASTSQPPLQAQQPPLVLNFPQSSTDSNTTSTVIVKLEPTEVPSDEMLHGKVSEQYEEVFENADDARPDDDNETDGKVEFKLLLNASDEPDYPGSTGCADELIGQNDSNQTVFTAGTGHVGSQQSSISSLKSSPFRPASKSFSIFSNPLPFNILPHQSTPTIPPSPSLPPRLSQSSRQTIIRPPCRSRPLPKSKTQLAKKMQSSVSKKCTEFFAVINRSASSVTERLQSSRMQQKEQQDLILMKNEGPPKLVHQALARSNFYTTRSVAQQTKSEDVTPLFKPAQNSLGCSKTSVLPVSPPSGQRLVALSRIDERKLGVDENYERLNTTEEKHDIELNDDRTCVDNFDSTYGWFIVSDIPEDISNMSVGQLCRSLELLSMSRYATSFRDSMIDGTLLLSLTEEMLVSDLHLGVLDARRLMMFAKQGWRPKLV